MVKFNKYVDISATKIDLKFQSIILYIDFATPRYCEHTR